MKNLIKKLLPTSLIKILRKIIPNEKNFLLKKLSFNNFSNIIFLGTEYGGWSIYDNKNIKNKYIISAGLGEDASFDIELISKFNCKIIVVDPTPRAIEHYNQIIENKGRPKIKPYTEDGKQSISSYDLRKINEENFILLDSALYNNDYEEIKFYEPPIKEHVSYSISDWQNNYKKNSNFIKVKTITVKNILKKFNLKEIEIIKLDIEGAEIEVLNNLLDEKILPNQILVEFDELNKINNQAKNRFLNIHERLLSQNYFLIKTINNFPNFLYLKKN